LSEHNGYYDFHSHILWGIDDGAASVEASLEIIRRKIELGFTHLVATPHIMDGVYNNDLAIITAHLAELRQVLQAENLPVQVYQGAEHYCDYRFYDSLRKKELVTLHDQSRYFLVEIPTIKDQKWLNEMLFEAGRRGYTPIIAHPERYQAVQDNKLDIAELVEQGAHLQINLGSLSGIYGRAARKAAEMLFKRELISFIGTDSHGYAEEHAAHCKAMNILAQLISPEYLDALLRVNPARALQGLTCEISQ
jgi:protein-tyrosine phosphatase